MIFGRHIEAVVAAQALAPSSATERERSDRQEPARMRVPAPVPIQPQQT